MERPFTSVGYKWMTALEGEVKAGKEGKVPRLDKQTMFGQSRWGLELCQFQIQWRFSWFCFSTAPLDGRVLEMFSQDLWSLNRWSFPTYFSLKSLIFHNCVKLFSYHEMISDCACWAKCSVSNKGWRWHSSGKVISSITFTFTVITFL